MPTLPRHALSETLPTATGPGAPRSAGSTTPTFRATPTGRFLVYLFRVCASLQLAIALLSLFALCLAVATFLESAYSGLIAQELIYHTWWFALLLGLLAVNILCAALKKYPWKRHQIGFLITHAGLIVLVFGGLLTTLGGVEGQMMLIDSDNRSIQQGLRMANKADTIQLANQQQLEIFRLPAIEARSASEGTNEARSASEGTNEARSASEGTPSLALRASKQNRELLREVLQVIEGGIEAGKGLKEKLGDNYRTFSLTPGSFAWHADEHFKPELPWGLRFLSALANPFPGFVRDLADGLTLEVKNYYPHTERWPFSPAEGDQRGFPALQLKLSTAMMPRPMKRWVTSVPSFEADAMPVAFEMLLLDEPALLPEFIQPPPPADLGKTGQLVLLVGHQKKLCRLALDGIKEGEAVELAGTALKFRLLRRGSLPELLDKKHAQKMKGPMPLFPAVEFELSGPGGKGTYMTCARLPHMPLFRDGQDVEAVAAWYHYPDFRWGKKQLMGSLQFLKLPDGRVFYRVYGKDGLRQKGTELDTADTGTVHRLPWQPMSMTFQVLAWLPRAVPREHVRPRHVRPGSDPSERLEPALRCELRRGGETKEFWVRLSNAATQVELGKERFFVRYRQDTRPLDFSLTLARAQQVSDPGTNRPASYQSDVVLSYDKGGKEVKEEHAIFMNHTLDHGGYKVYQTNYRPMTDPRSGQLILDEGGRLVSMSGLTVADDPGLGCKYAGSLLLVLGIATMFYMRAYFFKPRARSA